jgi:DNA-binding NarL/FixJ family response regulator
MSKGRIILVEDDSFTRAVLGDALVLQGFDVRARVATAVDAIKAQQLHNPDVAILDFDLGLGPTGIDVAVALRKNNPSIGLVFLTTYKDPRLIGQAIPTLPEGAIYLNKLDMGSTASIAEQVSLAFIKPTQKRSVPWIRSSPLGGMSLNQVEILKDISEGMSTKEIARKREVSEQAIEQSITRIMRHLGIEKTADTHQRVKIVRAYFDNKGQGT